MQAGNEVREMAKKEKYEDKTFWSVILILVGAGWLAVNLGLVSRQVLRMWPIALVLVGLVGLSGGLGRK